MIKYVTGDMFEHEAQARVNTVNCVGVMGKGIALLFKKRYPEMYKSYAEACKADEVRPGRAHVWKSDDLLSDTPIIVNLPTKTDWKRPSTYSYILKGLRWLRSFLLNENIKSITVPALGCGNGGLDWNVVSKLIEEWLGDLETTVLVFPPHSVGVHEFDRSQNEKAWALTLFVYRIDGNKEHDTLHSLLKRLGSEIPSQIDLVYTTPSRKLASATSGLLRQLESFGVRLEKSDARSFAPRLKSHINDTMGERIRSLVVCRDDKILDRFAGDLFEIPRRDVHFLRFSELSNGIFSALRSAGAEPIGLNKETMELNWEALGVPLRPIREPEGIEQKHQEVSQIEKKPEERTNKRSVESEPRELTKQAPDTPRLIERAFPLKQASLTSVHEKNVRHGHISTLHIWPARRPLAACRAALLATLLPDPGTPEARKELCERIGGKVVQSVERKKMPNGRIVERVKEEVEGGILGWIGTEPKSGGKKKIAEHQAAVAQREKELAFFREEIRKAYGGRAPRVLDPFAGGGAIPLEAMRLGCEATAVDINPVAWFILKCTLEYPQKLAGKTHPLPDFILEDEEFMESFYKAHPHLVGRTKRTKKQEEEATGDLFEKERIDAGRAPRADLAWHVRAWGRWVLNEARKELAPYYPTYADFERLDLKDKSPYERQEMRLVPLKENGTPDIEALNGEFTAEYLKSKRNPRWVAKPTVAYLWARTVKCKNCRAEVPLLKTRWLCKKDNKRVLLIMKPKADGTGVEFGIQDNVPAQGGNAAQKREHDKRISAGTMSRAGVQCPCCQTIMTMEDIRVEGKSGHLSAVATAVVVEGPSGKGYRVATEHEVKCALRAKKTIDHVYSSIPFGRPEEPTPAGGGRGAARAFSIQGYGLMKWRDVFTDRQLQTLGMVLRSSRTSLGELTSRGYDHTWTEAIYAGLAVGMDRIADRQSSICRWDNTRDNLQGTFTRFALPIIWDYCEGNPISQTTGNYLSNLEWLCEAWEHIMQASIASPTPKALNHSAIKMSDHQYDCIVTDPPYYDAIPYSDLMDFFYVWIKRFVSRTPLENGAFLLGETSPKWDHDANDGELIDDDSRHGGDSKASKQSYEDGMARAFIACEKSLTTDGRLVIVFAHKHPNAWETLVSAIIRAGFIVDGSWPIQTEMGNRMRGMNSAALSSSVWLVCKKRPATARPGWDNKVLEEMRAKIGDRLREFWDAGIRGPDFVWSATGPALEAYSKHPIVKKANTPNEVLGVGEFLSLVRRMVVDFVVGQVLTGEGEGSDLAAADRMDSPTAYYLLHRHDFGLAEAPAGACILYATACGLSDRDLDSAWDLVSHTGSKAAADDDDEDDADPDAEADPDDSGDSGGKLKLKTWAQRKRSSMGYEAPSGRPIPLIDRIHRLMHLWRAGDVHKVDEYLDEHGLRRQELFIRLVQSLIELADAGSEERALLESLSNHVRAKGATVQDASFLPKEEKGDE
ncbi:DUF1156 domain-containing protein [Candidatus Sumerlaeota bacterium]|nr:DUF1156 domain-containing protein [Candidatus Sumerlaeota bacterium]